MRRASVGQPTSPRMMEMKKNRVSALHSGGTNAASVMNSGIVGTVRTASVIIWRRPST